jgi:GNAT superfamily N-acetyltransferase
MAMLGYPIEGCLLGPAWQSLLDDPGYHLLIARSAQRAIGLAGCRFDIVLHHGGAVGTIHELVVDAELRNAGIGTLLVKEVLSEARRRGALRVELGAAGDRPEVARFYERLGFSLTGAKYAAVM